MQQTIQYLRQKLLPVYGPGETESLMGIIFQQLLCYGKNELILKARETLDPVVVSKIVQVAERLVKQEPIQYIFGETTFYGLTFKVNPSVLIPRNETEELVELILKDHTDAPIRVLDLGTGSGCIPVALKKHRPRFEVFACDVSEEALNVAISNARLHNIAINFFTDDILSDRDLPGGMFDIWVSNPPYVLDKERALMAPNVLEHEPALALFVPDTDPLLFYRVITLKAKNQLATGGKLYFEINEQYGKEVCALMETEGFVANVFPDIHGKTRMVRGIRS